VSIYPELAPSLDVKLLKRKIKNKRDILRRIVDFRNKRAAHWDMTLNGPLNRIKYGESKKLLEDLEDIFNEISGAHTQGIWSFKPLQHGDTSRMIDILNSATFK